MSHFSGSYPPDDVILLLERTEIVSTPVAEKEERIQRGQAHYFIDEIDAARRQRLELGLDSPVRLPRPADERWLQERRARARIDALAAEYDIRNYNRIKAGIPEATRAALRRQPERILLRDAKDPDTRLLRLLATRQSLPIEIVGDDLMPFRAVTLIRKRA